MKKILLFIIAGVIGFTACVQNEESESVAALRKAKADQLTSMAALNNAEAAATTVVANAQAALYAAQAAYQNAQAAYEQAQADAQDIRNQDAALALEIAKATLEQDIAKAILDAETALANSQAAFEAAQARLIASLDDVEQAERDRINNLINEANFVLFNLNAAKLNLVTVQTNLLQAENNLLDYEVEKENLIAKNEKKIAINEAIIEALGDPEESSYVYYQEQLAIADANSDLADAACDDAYAELKIVGIDAAVLKDYMNDIAYLNMHFDGDDFFYDKTDATLWIGYYGIPYQCEYMDYSNNLLSIDFEDCFDIINVFKDTTYVNYLDGQTYTGPIYFYNVNGALVWADYDIYLADSLAFEAKIKEVEDVDLVIAKPGYDAAVKTFSEALDSSKTPALKTLIVAVDTMQARWDRLHTQAAHDNLDAAKAALEAYCDDVEDDFETASIPYNNALLKIEVITFMRDIFCNFEKDEAYFETIAAYEEEMVKIAEAFADYMQIDAEWTYWHTYVVKLNNIIAGLTNVPQTIADLKEEIADWQQEIDDYEDMNDEIAMIEHFKAEMEGYMQEIIVLQAQYDALMAQIEALIDTEE